MQKAKLQHKSQNLKNSNIKILNPKQIQNPNDQNSKLLAKRVGTGL